VRGQGDRPRFSSTQSPIAYYKKLRRGVHVGLRKLASGGSALWNRANRRAVAPNQRYPCLATFTFARYGASKEEPLMTQPVPPLHAIMALLTAARTASFREAAAQLALTPSAFSRRIQVLESYLGVELYDRSGPVPRLTPSAIRYCQALEPAVQAICRATHSLRSAPPRPRLRRTCTSTVCWDCHRLPTCRETCGSTGETVHSTLGQRWASPCDSTPGH
jgi:hypothetical protein